MADIISHLDYNSIRDKIIEVMNVGSGDFGYGQVISSSDVATNQKVTKQQWDNLRFDIFNARLHQTGTNPDIVVIQNTDVVRKGANQPNYQYMTIAEQARTDRLLLGPGQSATTSAGSVSRNTAWANSISATVTVTFSTSDQARYFFNAGGKIRFTSSRTAGAATPQNTSWSSLLSAAGAQDFGSRTSPKGFYNLTNSYQTFFNSTSSSPYSSNQYTIEAKSNVADNSGGTATVVTFKITYTDGYADPGFPPPGDEVDGVLSLVVDEIKAVGTLLPTGTFSITSPTYSISSMSGS
jgi:hypothetical protein